jgi:hypothetical protein
MQCESVTGHIACLSSAPQEDVRSAMAISLTVRAQQAEFAWNLLAELRKELVECQKLRAQIIGAKVTFVSTALGVIAANLDKVDNALLIVPAFAAIFFDFLVNSYGFSIKRIGWYCRSYLEPLLKVGHTIPKEVLLWEEFLSQPGTKQALSVSGNLGITILAAGVGVVALLRPFRAGVSVPLFIALGFFLVLNLWSTLFAKWPKFPKPNRDIAGLLLDIEERTERPPAGSLQTVDGSSEGEPSAA